MNGFCTFFGAVLSWLSMCSPPHPGSFDPARFGYSETTAGRDLVAEVIARVNSIVEASDRLSVVPGWEKAK
jgi:hypothetical protein